MAEVSTGARGRYTERARGRYAKGEARRTAILDAVIHLFDTGDSGRPTLRAIAREVGIVESGVLRYFGSMDDLFVAVLDRRDEQAAHEFTLTTLDDVWVYLASTTRSPGLTELFVDMTLAARDERHPAAEFVRRHRERVGAVIAEALGQVSPDDVRLVIAVAEGLQIQWLQDRSVDIAGGVRRFVGLLQGCPGTIAP